MVRDKLTLILIACLSLMLILQVAGARQKSFWEDEAWTASIVQGDFNSVIRATARDVHPPLYFLMAAVWGRVFGYHELGLRSLSIVLSVATVLLAFGFTARAFDRKTASISASLLALSPFFLTYGHNARYYALSAALTLAILLLVYQYQRSGNLRYLIGYTITAVALLYTIYTGIAVLLGCWCWQLARWYQQRQQRQLRQQIGLWILAHCVIAVAYLPWVPLLLVTTNTGVDASSVTSWPGEIIKRMVYLGFVFSIGETLSPTKPVAWVGLLLVLAIAASLLVRRPRSGMLGSVLLLLLVIVAINIPVNIISIYTRYALQGIPNRTFYAFPIFIICLAYGIAQLRRGLARPALGLLLVVYGVGIFNYFGNREFMKPHLTTPWHSIMATIQQSGAADAMIVCNRVDFACRYYVQRYGGVSHEPEQWQARVAEQPQEVWWIYSNLGGEAVRGLEGQPLLQKARAAYTSTEVFNYGAHDPSIRWFKTRVLGQQDYAYRVELFRLTQPVKPVTQSSN